MGVVHDPGPGPFHSRSGEPLGFAEGIPHRGPPSQSVRGCGGVGEVRIVDGILRWGPLMVRVSSRSGPYVNVYLPYA